MQNRWQTFQNIPSRSIDFRFWRGILIVLVVLASLTLYWVGLLADHKEKVQGLERQTQLRSAQLAKTLAVQAQTLFSGLDFVAQNLIAEYVAGDAEGFDLAVRTATASYPSGSILQIAVADREGKVVYSNLQNPPRRVSGASIRDRDHFIFHAEDNNSGLYISQPLMGRVSNLWTIQTTRAIRKEGRFEGVVVVSVAPSYLSGFFREILEHSGDVIMLLRDDGAYMARSRDEASVLGKFVPKGREFLLRPESKNGHYDAAAPVDGVARYYAWHRVGALPLVLSMGLDKEAVWAPLNEEIRESLMRNLLGTALLTLGTLLIAWLSRQHKEVKAQAQRSEELLKNLVTQVPGALFQLHIQSDGKIYFPYATPSLYRLHHLEPEEKGRDAEVIFSSLLPEDAKRVREELHHAATHMNAWQGRYRISTKSGEVRWMLALAKPEQSADGGVLWHGYVQDVTQEQAMQQALRTSEHHLRLTMDAVHDGLWQWNLETQLVHWDARCWEMLGYPAIAAEVARDTMFQWMHPSDQERFQRRVQAHLERGENYHCEFRLRTAQGEWLWVEARGNITETIDGTPLQMLGTHTDISERVAQAQLRRVLLDEGAAAILLATPDRLIAHANRRAHNLFSVSGRSLFGQSLRIIHHDDASFDAFSACYAELREQGWASREWRFQLGDGSSRWFDIHGTLLDPQDPAGQAIWTIVDADERHCAVHDLRVAQQRLTAIIERFPAGVMVQEHLFGPIVAMNQELGDLLGLPHAVTQLPLDLENKASSILPPQMLIAPEQTSSVQWVEQQLPDGRTFEIHRIPLCEEGKSLGLFWMLRDITQRKQHESTLEHLAATDTLTGLPNRRSFMRRLQQEFDCLSSNHNAPAVLIMLDIDFFKRVNDTRGHGVGDQVLKHLSALLNESLRLRQGDLAGRLGGEEFAVLLAGAGLQGGMQIAERIRASIESTPAATDEGVIEFTASLGVSVLDTSVSHIDECLARADAALYYAKRHGRNQVCQWSEAVGSQAILEMS